MPVTRDEVAEALAALDPAALRAVLDCAGVPAWGADDPEALARRVANALWWTYHTPAGLLVRPATLGRITQHAARVLGVADAVDPQAQDWAQLSQLTAALSVKASEQGVRLEQVAEAERLRTRWKLPFGLATGAGGAMGSRTVALRILALAKGPIGRLLPYIPPLAPYVRVILGGARGVAAVSGPLAVALAILTLNQALGTRDRQLVPLLLGVGAARM